MLFPNVDLQVDQSADYSSTTLPWVVAGTVQNLTGYSTKFMVRAAPSDAAPLLSLTQTPNANGSVATPNTTAGTVTITINHLDTANLPYAQGPLLYEIMVTSGGGAVTAFQQGRAFINPAVAR